MPNGRSSAAVERLVAPGYLLAALLVVVPLVDYLASIWPPRLGEVQWRYASEGLLAGFLLTPYLGLALASGVAAWREHGRALQWFGRLTGVAVAVLVVVSGDFALNVLQLRETVPPAALARYDLGTAKTMLEYLLVALALAASGVGLVRMARALRASGARHAQADRVLVARKDVRGP